jgi:hypothetical protein
MPGSSSARGCANAASYLSAQPPSFVFLTHLRDHDDLYRIGASSFLRRYSDGEDDFARKMCSLPPIVAGEISFGFGPVRGEVVVVMRMGDELLGPRGGRSVIEGLEVARSCSWAGRWSACAGIWMTWGRGPGWRPASTVPWAARSSCC